MLIRYIAIRVRNAVALLGALAFAGFLLLDLAPGSFFDEMRLNPNISAATVESLRSSHGLGRPLLARFGSWAGSALRGDFGISLAYGEPASRLIFPRARNTVLLSGGALVLSWLIALPLGVWCAARPSGLLDRACSAGTAVLVTVPELVLGCVALLFLARTRWLPVGGMVSASFDSMPPSEQLLDVVRHLVLPAAILVWGGFPMIFRHCRSAIRDVAGAPFVKAARAHGIPEGRILFRHILPAAAHPLIALAGLSLGGLLSASLIVEVLVGWPGLGPLLVDAIASRDVFLIIDTVLLSGVFLIAGNLLADLMLYFVDPRVRVA